MKLPRWIIASLALIGVTLPAMAQGAAVERVSLGSSGAQGNNDSWSGSTSADGRWTAFVSTADNLVAGDTNNRSDVFLHDRTTGETRRISVRSDGTQGDGDQDSVPYGTVSFQPLYAETSMSADGRHIVFSSHSTNLTTAGTTNTYADIYTYDRVANTLTRLSTTAAGNDGNGESTDGRITPDGSHVVFTTTAFDLAPLSGTRSVLIADRATGELRQVCVATNGMACAGGATTGDASDGGRFVAFASPASNVVAGDTNGRMDVFVRDMTTGAIERVSVSATGQQASGGEARSPAISADGCRVAFISDATNLVDGVTAAGVRVYVRDRCVGTTVLASVATDGTPGTQVGLLPPDISADGCVVTFTSRDLSGNSPPADGLVARNLCAGTTNRMDTSATGVPATWATGWHSLSGSDGRFVTFDTIGHGVVPGDTNGQKDVFVRDRSFVSPPDPPVTPTPTPTAPAPPASGGPAPAAPRARKPVLVLTNVRVLPRAFFPVPATGPRPPGSGGVLRFTVSRSATITMRYQRGLPGVRQGRRCVLPRIGRGSVRGARCTRYVGVGMVRSRTVAGNRQIKLTGRINNRPLVKGQYRMIVYANASGLPRSRVSTVPFRIR